MDKQRQWLILEEPKIVYKKALKGYSNWKVNYIKFLKKIIELNPYIGFDLDDQNNVWISPRYLEGRYLSNPRYKKDGVLPPNSVALSKQVINKLPNKDNINKKNGDILLTVINSYQEIEIVEDYLNRLFKGGIKKYSKLHIYRLTPDIIGFLHNIIYNGYKDGTVIYKSNKSKQWQE